jgi:hypothetical protein
MATIALTILAPTRPQGYDSKDTAFPAHYEEGGYLWKRRDGQSEAYKLFLSGVPSAKKLDIYELFMVDGRQPTEDNIREAEQACKEAQKFEEEIAYA